MNEIERKNLLCNASKKRKRHFFSFALNDEAEGKKAKKGEQRKTILQPNLSRFLD